MFAKLPLDKQQFQFIRNINVKFKFDRVRFATVECWLICYFLLLLSNDIWSEIVFFFFTYVIELDAHQTRIYYTQPNHPVTTERTYKI